MKLSTLRAILKTIADKRGSDINVFIGKSDFNVIESDNILLLTRL